MAHYSGTSPVERKATRDHVCNKCGCEIKKGQRYVHSVTRSDFLNFNVRTCIPCDYVEKEHRSFYDYEKEGADK